MRVGTQAGEPEEAPVPLLQKDRRRITEMVAHMKTFEDYKRILLLGGNAKRAKVLIELVRTGKTTLTSRKPFVTWRVEVWDYFKLYGSWRQKRGLGMVIRRQRIEKQNFNRLSWVFESKLGGLKLGAPDAVSKVNYEIPEVLSGLPGRWSGEESPIPEPAKEAGEAHNSEK